MNLLRYLKEHSLDKSTLSVKKKLVETKGLILCAQ